MKEITLWMIVQSNNSKHIDNFNTINQKIHLQYFPAIQSCEHYQIFSDFAVHKNYFQKTYVNQLQNSPSILGENLSHMLLFNKIIEKSNHDWNLILDGSILLDINKFLDNYEEIIKTAEEKECECIQLYMPPKFFVMNNRAKCEDKELYDLSLQIDNKAYLIHKKGISKFIEHYPLQKNITEQFGEMIPSWKSLYWKNDCFHVM